MFVFHLDLNLYNDLHLVKIQVFIIQKFIFTNLIDLKILSQIFIINFFFFHCLVLIYAIQIIFNLVVILFIKITNLFD